VAFKSKEENKEKANDNENTQINSETQKPDELTLLRKAEKEEEEEFDQMIKQLQKHREQEREYYRRHLKLGRILWDIGSVFTIFGAFLTITGYSTFLSAIASHTHPSLSLSFEVGFAIYIVGLVMGALGRRIREKGDDWS